MINVRLPEDGPPKLEPRIVVIGVGGAGCNAVNNMIRSELDGVDFVAANTDAQALENNLSQRKLQLGRNATRGLGAGSRPEIGREAAEEALEDITTCLDGADMAFITAGMGGGTGTGAAPVIARIAREHGILTVGVVTKPFQFEGPYRMRMAEQGLQELQQYVDTMIVIPNQNLFRVANAQTTFAEAFTLADDVLHAGVRGVTDLIVVPGMINLDFADIRTVMSEMGKAMMGTGEAEGENRAKDAADIAISNPLLDEVSLTGARAMLVNITGGMDLQLFELDEAVNHIAAHIDGDANIKVGTSLHPDMEGRMRVSVIATGMDADEAEQPQGGNVHVLKERRPQQPQPAQAKHSTAMQADASRPVTVEADYEAADAEAESSAVTGETQATPAANPALEDSFIPPEPVRPARSAPRAMPRTAMRGESAGTPQGEDNRKQDAGFFGRMTRGLRASKSEESQAVPEPPPLPPEARADQQSGQVDEPVQQDLDITVVRPRSTRPPADDANLDIPAFLRRQAN